MKKFYFLLLGALLCIGTGVAQAEEWAFDVEWDTPGSVVLKKGYQVIELPEGATSYHYVGDSEWATTLSVNPGAGYKIDEVYYMDGDSKVLVNKGYAGYSLSMSTCNGKTVQVVASELVFDGQLTVNVLNAPNTIAGISFNGSGSYNGSFVKGQNLIPYVTGLDTQITLTATADVYVGTTYRKFFKVTQNGNEVSYNTYKGGYVFNFNDGDVIEIQPWEVDPGDEVETCTVTLPADLTGIVSIFNFGTSAFVNLNAGSFEIEKGKKFRVNFDADYDINWVKYGTTMLDPENAQVVVEESAALTYSYQPKAYEMVTYTLYAEHAEGLEVYAGNAYSGYLLDLGEGEPIDAPIELRADSGAGEPACTMDPGHTRKYTFEVSSKYGQYMAVAKEGYWMRAKRGADMSYNEGNFTDATAYILCEPYEPDTQAIVWYAGEPGRVKLASSNLHGTPVQHELVAGYQVLDFDLDYEVEFAAKTGLVIDGMQVTLDGVYQKRDDNEVFSGLKLAQNSVLKVFADGQVWDEKLVRFTHENELTSAEVTFDMVRVHENHFQDLSVHDGTLVCIKPSRDTRVYVDGVALPCDEEGVASFTVGEFEGAAPAANRAASEVAHSVTFAYVPADAYVLTPDPEQSVESLETIVISFPNATSVTRTGLSDDEIYFAAADQSWAPSFIKVTEAEGLEAPSFAISLSPAPTRATAYRLLIPEGFFTVDGETNSDIEVTYTITKTVSELNYEFSPMGDKMLASEWGLMVAVIFDEDLNVTVADQSKISFVWNGQTVPEDDAMSMCEANMFMAQLYGEAYNGQAGTLTMTLAEGALLASGNPSPAIEKTWEVVLPREYTMDVTPQSVQDLASLSKFTVTFPDADNVEIFNEYGARLEETSYVSGRYYETGTITKVEDAAVPTFEIDFPAPTKQTSYKFTLNYGTFTIDGLQDSEQTTLTFTDVTTGVAQLGADSAEAPVYNLQGIAVGKGLDKLPAGIYIVNGRKVTVK